MYTSHKSCLDTLDSVPEKNVASCVRTSFISAILPALDLAEASIYRRSPPNLRGKDEDMKQEEEIGDLDLPVEKLDRKDGEGEEDASDKSYYDSDEEDIGDGLLIYDCPPSQDTHRMWQWHFPLEFIPDGCVEYDDRSGSGKWMLFYPVSEIDEKWKMAQDLFDTGQLRGVEGMKVSTAMDNPRSSDNTKAVLIMYCGPWTDELLMRKIGRNLALKTKYENKTLGCMMYKTDDQTRGGTRATGQAVNHVYQMQVPRPIEGTDSSAMPELLPSKDTRDFWQWHFPTCSPSGCAEEYDYSKSGRWMLFYSSAEIDEKWQMMKSLLDSNELDGVRGLKVSTASSKPVNQKGNNSSAVITVYCGPWDDEDLVLRVGANLVQKTSYKDKSGTLRYKTDIVGKGSASLEQLMPKYNQVLPVPRPSVGANYSQPGVAELPPSKDLRSYWQWHPKSQDGRFTNYDSSLRGKWMLFYPLSDIDVMWQMMKDLFDAGELQGVSDAKVSTAGHPDKNSRVIMVYCGPCNDAELMLKIGENVALKTKYKDTSGIMRYKVDAPREGRRATGQGSPSYWVQVPKPQAMWASAWDTAEQPPSRDTAECPPSRDKRNFWQWHRKPLDGIEYDPSTRGKWMLFYTTSKIDDRWHLVKSLFDAGDLHGVGELKVSTAKGNAGHPDSGVINVYCGPYNDGELMMRIGENLAKKMQYKNRKGVMLYKTEGQQMKHGRAMRQGWNHLYEISLPWRY